jgi:hypothetical protein
MAERRLLSKAKRVRLLGFYAEAYFCWGCAVSKRHESSVISGGNN